MTTKETTQEDNDKKQESSLEETGTAPKGEDIKKDKKDADDRERVGAGMLVRVYEKIIDTTPKGEKRERLQLFKGMVLARKHGKEPGASITVRKESDGVGVEKIFPLYNPLIDRIVIDKRFKTRRSKLYFLRRGNQRLKEVG